MSDEKDLEEFRAREHRKKIKRAKREVIRAAIAWNKSDDGGEAGVELSTACEHLEDMEGLES